MTLIADVVYMNQASSRVFEEELLLLKVLLHILESAVVDWVVGVVVGQGF